MRSLIAIFSGITGEVPIGLGRPAQGKSHGDLRMWAINDRSMNGTAVPKYPENLIHFCRPVLEHYELHDEMGRMFVRSMTNGLPTGARQFWLVRLSI